MPRSRTRHRPAPPPPPRPLYPGEVPGESNVMPISTWPIEMVRAVAVAYRNAEGQGLEQIACAEAARTAYLAHGGDPELAGGDIFRILRSVAEKHGEWLRAPRRRWSERADRYWRSQGIWPPPLDRRTWPPIPDDA